MFLPSPWGAEPHCSGKAETVSDRGPACVCLAENSRVGGRGSPMHPEAPGNHDELKMVAPILLCTQIPLRTSSSWEQEPVAIYEPSVGNSA